MKRKRCAAMLMASLMLFNQAAVFAAYETEGTAQTSAYAYENTVEYDVTGGTISFDKDTGEVYHASDSVTEVIIPEEIEGATVRTIRYGAFSGKYKLTKVVLPDTITSIGDSAFANCTALRSINLPDSVTSIGTYAFAGAPLGSTLGSVLKLPANLETLGDYPFDINSGVSAFTLAESNPNFAVKDGILYTKDMQTLLACPAKKGGTINVPDGVKTIADRAFDFTVADEVILPDTVGTIGDRAFRAADYQHSGVSSYLKTVRMSKNIKSIGDYAFHERHVLEMPELPDTLEELGAYAFENCTAITSVKVPKNIKKINDQTFYCCTSLKEVSLPEGLESIGKSAFLSTPIENIDIPSTVREIGESAFTNCKNIKSVVIPDGVTVINARTFSECESLKEVSVPNSVKMVGDYAFAVTAVESIDLPDLDGLGEGVFSDCSELVSVNTPNGLPSLPGHLFQSCSKLKNFTVNENAQMSDYVGEYTFLNCTSLTDEDMKKLPAKTRSFGYGAFAGCTGLVAPELPSGLTGIGERAFADCTNLTDIVLPDGFKEFVGYGAFHGCTSLTNVVIPNTVNSIAGGTFVSCKALEEISIPKSVVELNGDIFFGCDDLKKVYLNSNIKYIYNDPFRYSNQDAANALHKPQITLYVPENSVIHKWAVDNEYNFEIYEEPKNTEYEVTGGSLLFDEKTGFIMGYIGEPTVIEIPDEIKGVKVVGIGSGAFKECESLTDVKISKNVGYIGPAAFSNCTKLESIELPPITKIEAETFFFCTSLKSIDIPKTVTEIGKKAFLQNYVLEKVSMGDNVTNIGEMAFKNCYKLESIKLSKGIKKIEDEAFTSDAMLYDITLPDGLEYIGTNAFYSCFCNTLIKQGEYRLTIPDSVTYIGSYAFSSCQGVYYMDLPKNITQIEHDTFYYMTHLREVEIPSSVKTIDYDAFFQCSGLKSVTLNEGLEVIGERAFCRCTNLFEVNIPATVTTVNNEAFAQNDTTMMSSYRTASNLMAIHIPKSVVYMGDNIFHGDQTTKLVLFVEKDSTAEQYAKDNNLIYSYGEFVQYPVDGGNIYFDTGNNNIVCADNLNYIKSVNIPSEIDGVKVETIGTGAFSGAYNMKKVVIADGITKIGSQAFNNCGNLESAVIPASVTEIGGYAFSGLYNKENFVMYVYPESYAEQYAKDNGFNYEYISEEEHFAGDADGDGEITAGDSAYVLQKALVSTFELPVQKSDPENWKTYIDVDRDGEITAGDSAYVLQKALVRTFKFPIEK